MSLLKSLERRAKKLVLKSVCLFMPESRQYETIHDKQGEIKKILVLRLDNRMGNLTMTTFFPRALREIYPDAEIHICMPSNLRLIWENNPFVGRIIEFDPAVHLRNPFHLIRFLYSLRKAGYDLVIDNSNPVSFSVSNGILTRFTGARFRVGFRRGESPLFLNVMTGADQSKHYIDIMNSLLGLLRPGGNSYRPEIFLTDKEMESARARIAGLNYDRKKKLVILCAGATKYRLDLQNFIDLKKRLCAESNVQVLFLCSIFEKDDYTKLSRDDPDTCLYVENKKELAALIKEADLFVAVDGGLLHLAYAVGTGTVGIFLQDFYTTFGYENGKEHRIVALELPGAQAGGINTVGVREIETIYSTVREALNAAENGRPE
ncbi:glycosyltransferase family 9 protein [candidate division KSB1 bacterium]